MMFVDNEIDVLDEHSHLGLDAEYAFRLRSLALRLIKRLKDERRDQFDDISVYRAVAD
jgi:hypothetical protein